MLRLGAISVAAFGLVAVLFFWAKWGQAFHHTDPSRPSSPINAGGIGGRTHIWASSYAHGEHINAVRDMPTALFLTGVIVAFLYIMYLVQLYLSSKVFHIPTKQLVRGVWRGRGHARPAALMSRARRINGEKSPVKCPVNSPPRGHARYSGWGHSGLGAMHSKQQQPEKQQGQQQKDNGETSPVGSLPRGQQRYSGWGGVHSKQQRQERKEEQEHNQLKHRQAYEQAYGQVYGGGDGGGGGGGEEDAGGGVGVARTTGGLASSVHGGGAAGLQRNSAPGAYGGSAPEDVGRWGGWGRAISGWLPKRQHDGYAQLDPSPQPPARRWQRDGRWSINSLDETSIVSDALSFRRNSPPPLSAAPSFLQVLRTSLSSCVGPAGPSDRLSEPAAAAQGRRGRGSDMTPVSRGTQ